jgi:hypothetical protein
MKHPNTVREEAHGTGRFLWPKPDFTKGRLRKVDYPLSRAKFSAFKRLERIQFFSLVGQQLSPAPAHRVAYLGHLSVCDASENTLTTNGLGL